MPSFLVGSRQIILQTEKSRNKVQACLLKNIGGKYQKKYLKELMMAVLRAWELGYGRVRPGTDFFSLPVRLVE